MISLAVLKKISSQKYTNMRQENNMDFYLYVLNYLKVIGSSLVKVIKFNNCYFEASTYWDCHQSELSSSQVYLWEQPVVNFQVSTYWDYRLGFVYFFMNPSSPYLGRDNQADLYLLCNFPCLHSWESKYYRDHLFQSFSTHLLNHQLFQGLYQGVHYAGVLISILQLNRSYRGVQSYKQISWHQVLFA